MYTIRLLVPMYVRSSLKLYVSATQTMKDWKLFIIVLMITGLGLAVLLVQLIVPSFRYEPALVVDRGNPSGVNVSSFYRCL